MNTNHTTTRRPAPATPSRLLPLMATVTLAVACGAAQAQQVLAPNAPIASFSQSYLAGQFGQWGSSYPNGANPTRDDTGAFSALGDQGSYFFLGASEKQTPIVRNVTVRPDQTLFISLLSYIDYTGPGVETEAALREEVGYALGIVSNMTLTVDGVPALMPAGYSSLQAFRQSSPLFPITFIDNNIYGLPAAVLPAIVEGYFVGLQGLPAGQHQLHFTAFSEPTGPFTGLFSLAQDITYNVTSVPETSSLAMMGLGLAAIAAGALRRRRLSAP